MPPTEAQKNKLKNLLAIQKPNGAFDLDDKFCKIVELDLKSLQTECQEQIKPFNTTAFATTIAMVYFEQKLNHIYLKPKWQKEYDKAKLYVYKNWASSLPTLRVHAESRVIKGEMYPDNKKVFREADRRPTFSK